MGVIIRTLEERREVGIFHAAMMRIVRQNMTACDVKVDNVGAPDQVELVDRGIEY